MDRDEAAKPDHDLTIKRRFWMRWCWVSVGGTLLGFILMLTFGQDMCSNLAGTSAFVSLAGPVALVIGLVGLGIRSPGRRTEMFAGAGCVTVMWLIVASIMTLAYAMTGTAECL